MQLGYSGQQNKQTPADRLMLLLAAILSGSSAMAVFCSAFQLQWSPGSAFQGNPVSGFLSVCNSIADRLGASDYIILQKFAAGAASDGSSLPQGMCLSILLLLAILLSYLILRSDCTWLLLLLSGPAAALVLLTHTAPGIWAGAFFVFAQACCFALMQRSQDKGSGWVLLLPAAALCLTVLAGAAMEQGPGLTATALQHTSGAAIEEALQGRYGSDPLDRGRLDRLSGEELLKQRGSLDNALRQMSGETKDDTKTALKVTAENGQTMQACYLRGFIGENYNNGRWSGLGTDQYYGERDDLYWLNRQGFDGLSQLSEAAALAGNAEEPVQLTVTVEKADRSLVYAPYEMTGTESALPKGTVNYAGAFLGPAHRRGSREYSWELLPGLTGQWTDWVGRLYSAASDASLQQYFVSESHYNVWCYENDTKLSDEVSGLMYSALGDPGDLSRDHADYRETITLIREHLDGNYIYTDQFEPPKEGTDPMEAFLKSGKGCDAHYASLAALMFRHYGIPSRYVEGYLITPRDAEQIADTGAAEIGFSHAHAWTEIYIDGFGWVPLEMTGEYRKIMPEADLEKGLESITYEKKLQEQITEEPEEITDSAPAQNYGKILRRVLLAALLLLIALVLIWILQRMIRQMIRRRRLQLAFADPDPRRGICAMYGYMMAEEIPLSADAVEIGDRAAYSNLEIRESERSLMQQELKRGQDEKKEMDKNMGHGIADRVSGALHRLRKQ